MKIYAGQCGSFSGDGRRDILARRPSTGELFVIPHRGAFDGTDTYGPPELIRTGVDSFFRWLGAGDFTGSGTADVLANTGDDQVRLYVNQGGLSGTETLAEEGIHVGGKLSEDVSYDTIALGDLTGDGRTDVIGRLAGTREVHVMVNQGVDGLNTFAPPKHLITIGEHEVPFGLADVTGTGRLDLLVDCPLDGGLALYDLSGGDARHPIAAGWDDKIMITITDVDGDGCPDLLGLLPDGTMLAYRHRGTFDAQRPLDTFEAPVVVGTGWNVYDILG